MMIDLSKFVVRNVDGTLDLQGTLDSITPEVVSLVEKQDSDTLEVAKAVHAVFDMFQGSRLNTAALTSFALQHLTVTPESAGEVTGKIAEYIKVNSGERGSSLFSVKRGKGGGVARWADVTE